MTTIDKGDICLVTGGLGFLGFHLVEYLVKKNYRVRVIDVGQAQDWQLQHVANQVEFFTGSINDVETIKNCLKGVRYLFHYAGTTLPAISNRNPIEDVSINLTSNLSLLNEAVKEGVEKVIFPSSGGTVYGIPCQTPILETHPTNPISSYGIVKLATEKYLGLFEREYGLKYVALRYSNPYGPYQNPFRNFGAIATFLGRIVVNEPLTILGDGSVVRDFIYVEDAIKATYKAVLYSGEDRVFNIGMGRGISISELINIIQNVTGEQCETIHHPARKSDVPKSVLDITKAKKELNWKPMISLDDGIAKTWDWILHISGTHNYDK